MEVSWGPWGGLPGQGPLLRDCGPAESPPGRRKFAFLVSPWPAPTFSKSRASVQAPGELALRIFAGFGSPGCRRPTGWVFCGSGHR